MDANGIFDIHSVKRFFPEGGGGKGKGTDARDLLSSGFLSKRRPISVRG